MCVIIKKMRLLYFAAYVLLSLSSVNCVPSLQPCSKERCPQTEYTAYIKCITGHSRTKRQAPCYYDYKVTGPDCQARYALCMSTCTYASGCSSRCPPCPLQPASQVHIVQHHGGQPACTGSPTQCQLQPADHTSVPSEKQNITTIIKLTNLINNTNIVHVPTSINNTNINNINFNETETQTEETPDNPCCTIVYKHSCNYGHCKHARRHSCGPQCNARIIHDHSYLHCHGSSCKKRRTYIPQPNSPSCVHSRNWPYVSCGYRKEQKYCYGCYDHYGYGYETYYTNRQKPNCDGCYDDGYDTGPLYRHGPYYQPGYYHQPQMQFAVFYQPILYPVAPMFMGPYNPNKMNMRRRNFNQYQEEIEDQTDDYDYDFNETPYIDDTKCRIVSKNGTRYACDHDIHNNNVYLRRNHGVQKSVNLDKMNGEIENFDVRDSKLRMKKSHSIISEPDTEARVVIYKKD